MMSMLHNLAILGLLAVVTAVAPAAAADPIVVGDCSTLGGACAAVCAEGVADCGGNDLACIGVSYQVPQCVESDLAVAAHGPPRCASPVCDAVNVVCVKVFGVRCVA